MDLSAYFASLNLLNLLSRMPAAVAQGLIWGLMALGVFVTFRLLDIADLTVDGSFATGGAVTVMLLLAGWPAWAALLAAIEAEGRKMGITNLISIITDENAASCRFHEKNGFVKEGHLHDIAVKFGRRCGVCYYRKELG